MKRTIIAAAILVITVAMVPPVHAQEQGVRVSHGDS